ncbi:MAG: hypothetical protein R2712_12450 [Vicinamibacterales bacterium]
MALLAIAGTRPSTPTPSGSLEAVERATYEGFTIDDVIGVVGACGFRCDTVRESAERAVLLLTRRTVHATATCLDPLDGERIFQRLVLALEPWHAGDETEQVLPRGRNDGARIQSSLERTLTFDGGVTMEWVMRQVGEWNALVRRVRRGGGRERKARGWVH